MQQLKLFANLKYFNVKHKKECISYATKRQKKQIKRIKVKPQPIQQYTLLKIYIQNYNKIFPL